MTESNIAANSRAPKGIQIVGTQRSGSNLLRVILDQSPEIASPHPPHMLVTFGPLMHYYEPLDRRRYAQLVSDIVDFVRANPVPWEGVTLDKTELIEASDRHTLFDLNRLIYQRAAQAKKATYWCCKSMANVHFADELEAHGIIDKYVFLYRDGRDVAASFKKAVVGEKHSYFLAKQWKQDQDACLLLAEKLGEDRFFALNYETLVSEPERAVRQLCTFLRIDYVSEMLDFHTSNSSRITAAAGEMWANLEKPIMRNNTGNFLKSFEADDLEIFELVAGDTLQKLGYPLHTDRTNSSLLSPENIAQYEEVNSRLKKGVLATARKSDLEKRAPQQQLLDTIKNKQTASYVQATG